jgi:hypothetical protein
MNFAGLTNKLALSVINQRIPTVEHTQRTKRFQAQRGVVNTAFALHSKIAPRALQPLFHRTMTRTIPRSHNRRRTPAKTSLQPLNMHQPLAEKRTHTGSSAELKIIDALCLAPKPVLRAPQHHLHRKMRVTLAGTHQLKLPRAKHTCSQPLDALLNAMLRSSHQLRSRGRRRCANISSSIRDSGIRSVPNAGNHGQGTSSNRAHHTLIVEAVQVFPASTTTSHKDNIRAVSMPREPGKPTCNFKRTTRPLHRRRINQQINARMPTATDLDNVSQRRALQAGDNTNTARKRRQRTLAVKQSFATQPLFELTRSRQQSAQANLLHALSDKLHLPTLLINSERASEPHSIAILRTKPQPLRLRAKHHNRNLRQAVLKREVAMPTPRRPPVGNFAFNRNRAVPTLQRPTHLPHQLAYGKNFRLYNSRRNRCRRGYNRLHFNNSRFRFFLTTKVKKRRPAERSFTPPRNSAATKLRKGRWWIVGHSHALQVYAAERAASSSRVSRNSSSGGQGLASSFSRRFMRMDCRCTLEALEE